MIGIRPLQFAEEDEEEERHEQRDVPPDALAAEAVGPVLEALPGPLVEVLESAGHPPSASAPATATIRTTAMTIHIVRIEFEMLTSQNTRPGGAWWPAG